MKPCLQGLVVLHWGLGHFLKMGHLGLVGKCWWGMNIAGTEVVYFCQFLINYMVINLKKKGPKNRSLRPSLICRSQYVVFGDTNWSWVFLFNRYLLLCGCKWQDHRYVLSQTYSLFFWVFWVNFWFCKCIWGWIYLTEDSSQLVSFFSFLAFWFI